MSQADNYGIQAWELDPFFADEEDAMEELLSEGWRRKALTEVAEKAKWRQRDIDAIAVMVKGVKLLHCPTTNAFLLRFLRAQKFDYDKALEMLERYYIMRQTWPDNFAKALPSLAKGIFEPQLQTILPHRDRLGRRVMLFRPCWDTNKLTPPDLFAANVLLMETVAREPKTQIAGLVIFIDMSGFRYCHFKQLTFNFFESIAAIIQNRFPLRFREIHIINQGYLFTLAYGLMSSLLSSRIKERIKLHGTNLSGIHEVMSPDYLPEEFGGSCGPISNTEVVNAMLEREDYFEDLKQYGFAEKVNEEDLDLNNSSPALPAPYCQSSEA